MSLGFYIDIGIIWQGQIVNWRAVLKAELKHIQRLAIQTRLQKFYLIPFKVKNTEEQGSFKLVKRRVASLDQVFANGLGQNVGHAPVLIQG